MADRRITAKGQTFAGETAGRRTSAGQILLVQASTTRTFVRQTSAGPDLVLLSSTRRISAWQISAGRTSARRLSLARISPMRTSARLDLAGHSSGGWHLSGARLCGTDFSAMGPTEAAGIEFVDIDLSTANGLDTIEHHGPSWVGIDTIYKSRGKIPRSSCVDAACRTS